MQDCQMKRALDLYGDLVYRVCLASLRHREDAEDAAQESFLRAIRAGVTFESDEHAKAYLLRTAVSVCRDVMRRRIRHGTVSDELLEDVAAPTESREVWQALLRLPEPYRVPLLLHATEGYTAEEIAARIGVSREAIKKRLQRGRKLLAKELGWSDKVAPEEET